jgi:hypothetical protein
VDYATDFIAALDEDRYPSFKTYILNGMAADTFPVPPNANNAFVKASAFLTGASKIKASEG